MRVSVTADLTTGATVKAVRYRQVEISQDNLTITVNLSVLEALAATAKRRVANKEARAAELEAMSTGPMTS